MSAAAVPVACTCGGTITHTTSSRTYSHGVSGVATCTTCGTVWRVDVRMLVLDGPFDRPARNGARRLRDPEAWGARVIDSIMAVAG
jgi:hypothetical protein